MKQASPEKKDSVLKTLAIAGFVAIIIFIAWLSIQLVTVLPGAFTSLASLAEGVNQYQQSIIEPEPIVDIAVSSNTGLVNAGDQATIIWDTTDTPGTYSFSYECKDGVAVDIVNPDGLQSIACETNYNIGNVDSLTIAIDSEKHRYADLNYTIAFLQTDESEPRASGDAHITIVNSDVSTVGADDEPADEQVAANDAPSTEPVVTEPEETPADPEPEVAGVSDESTDTSPAAPVFEQEFIYAIPTSDPNGRTDLATRFLSVGDIINGTYLPTFLTTSENGAIQFEVRNLGTKTSGDWTYSVTLPNGSTYESPEQAPLKPSERAVITLGFPPSDVDTHTFRVEVDTTADFSPINDSFAETVPFSG